jgi:hypothetical protein
MAYGMRPEELAKVGQNINRNGGEVTEESIAQGVDEEMSQDRKEAVERNKERKQTAVQKDAKQKAALKSKMIQAVTKSTVDTVGAVSSSEKAEANRASRKEARLAKRADRMQAKGRDSAKVDRVRTRSAESGFKAAKLNPDKYGQKTGSYSQPGSLYGGKTSESEVDMGVERSAGADPAAAKFQSQLMSNRKRSTPISAKEQYLMESRRLTDLKKQFGN